MENRIKWIMFSIIASILIFYSICFAEIQPVSIDDMKDHSKLTNTLNKIIKKINQDQKNDKADSKDFKDFLKYQISVDNQMVKKMINKGWVSTHAEVEP